MDRKDKPLVSIIFAAYNETAHTKRLLDSIKSQSYENIETLVVVDKKTTDDTFDVAKNNGAIAIIGSMERSENRNIGAKKAKGEYLMVLDADMILTKDVVKDCVDVVIKDSEIKTVTIPEKSIGTSFWAKCKAFERNFYYLDENSNIEAARFFEKKAFMEVGGYDPNITGPEDWDLPEQINKMYPKKHKIKAHIIHNEGNVNLIKLIKKKYYYGKKANIYLEKNEVSKVSSKTIYFLRPVFYRHWKLWLKNPMISIGTFTMLTGEFIAGVLGYLIGKYKPMSAKI